MATTAALTDSIECWQLIPHACRHCGGRILRARTSTRTVFMCSGCEVVCVGTHRGVCACGVTITAGPDRGRRPFQCVQLGARGLPHNPARIGIAYGDRELLPEGQAAKRSGPVELVEKR